MNLSSSKRVLFSILVVMLLLPACGPAPAASQDPAIVQQLIEQSVALTVAADDSEVKDEQLIKQSVALTVAAANVPPNEQQAALAAQAAFTPTATPFVVTPEPAESNPAGTATVDPNAPTVLSISPKIGPTTGGTIVTITGTNFVVGREHTHFLFNEVEATNVICTSTTQCTAKAPAGGEGHVIVRAVIVGNPQSDEANRNDSFSYTVVDTDAPTIKTISPRKGPTGGGTIVKITGTNFVVGEEDTHFYFGDNEATDVICDSKTQCTAKSPPGKEGIVIVEASVIVGSQQLDSYRPDPNSKTDSFIYTAPAQYGCSVLTVTPKNLTIMSSGEEFVIKWIVANKGTNSWPAGLDMKFSGGTNMGVKSSTEIPMILKPGGTYDFKLNAVAPTNPGTYYMTWIVEGQGCDAYVAIVVE